MNGHDDNNKTKQQGSSLAAFIVSSIFFAHKLAQSLYLFIVYYWFTFIFVFIVIVVIKQHREHVLYCLALCITHYVNGCIYYLCEELMLQCVTATIASDDTLDVPELQIVKKGVMSNTNFANDQLIDVAGGF